MVDEMGEQGANANIWVLTEAYRPNLRVTTILKPRQQLDISPGLTKALPLWITGVCGIEI